jgi:single-strand DNA-binding protein
MSFNSCIFTGNLGNDPETKNAASGGTTFTTFSIAVNKPGADRDTKPLWINVVAFGKTGEFVGKYLKKGSKVLVQGALELQEYEAKDGTTKTSLKLLAARVESLDSKAAASGTPAQSTTATASASASKPLVDEDIPF